MPKDLPERESLIQELVDLHDQMLARDTAFRAWDERVETLQREKQEMRQRLDEAAAEVSELSQTIAGMQATRIWRLGQRYWTTREWFKRLMRRGG